MAQFARILTAVLLALAVGGAASPAIAKDKKPDAGKYGLIAGTVFQRSGLLLRGARITVTPDPEDGSGVDGRPVEEAITDARGEFAVRVPAGSMRYNVKVEADGWQPAEKVVHVEWDQRVDVSFRLRPMSDEGIE